MPSAAAIRDRLEAGDEREALRLAARIKTRKATFAAIRRAHECYVRPDFYRQLGRDPDTEKRRGVEALRREFS